MSLREQTICDRCDGDGELRMSSGPGTRTTTEDCPDCQGHGFLLTCRCGHLMPVGESMCSLCEAQAEAAEEER